MDGDRRAWIEASGVSLAAGPGHRRRVAELLVGLALFFALYLGLIAGLVALIVVVGVLARSTPWLWPVAVVVAVVTVPLIALMVRGLVHRPPLVSDRASVDGDGHPRLRALVDGLAEDLGARAPEHLRIVPGVNAAMVLVHGRRELVVGLGLVNVLGQRELEAVLAHELGHFAQSSTAVGQRAHRVVIGLQTLVLGRTSLDAGPGPKGKTRRLGRGLRQVTAIGLDGTRRILRPALGVLVRLERALARELELNADLHAVAACGSDALIAALWQSQRGSLAMSLARGQLAELAKHGLYSDDLYHHQRARLAELEGILDPGGDPVVAALCTPYVPGPAVHFPPGQAAAELAGYAHPSCHAREHNAKRLYVPPPPGTSASAWALFEDPEALRRALSLAVYAELRPSGRAPELDQLRDAAEIERRVAAELDERRRAPEFHGFYDNRVIDPGPLDALMSELEGLPEATANPALEADAAAWRGPALEAFMMCWRETEAALDQLRGQTDVDTDADTIATRERLEQDRVAQVAAAQVGDRAVFRSIYARADASERAELCARHRFLAVVQAELMVLNDHHARLSRVRGPDELQGAALELHDQLRAMLARTATVELPALANLAEADSDGRASLGARLLDGELVPAFDPDVEGAGAGEGDRLAFGPWMQAFMAQVRELHGCLRTLHFKNIGRLVDLRARLEGP